jgi:hypothetical protein
MLLEMVDQADQGVEEVILHQVVQELLDKEMMEDQQVFQIHNTDLTEEAVVKLLLELARIL